MKKRLHILIGLLFLLFSCTENPFFTDTIDTPNRISVEGKVALNDDANPAGVFVWLERFNLSTFTDSSGYFKLKLPDPHLQPGEGLNGVYSIYFYLANFKVKTASLLLLNGQIEYGKGDVNENGRIKNTIVLQKILDIATEIIPAKVQDDNKDPLDIVITLNNQIDSVHVATYKHITGQTSCIIIKPEDKPIESAILLQGIGTELRDEWITQKTVWLMRYQFSVGFFSPGKYEFIPYIIIYQDELPDELIAAIDEEALSFTYRFLNLPFKQKIGHLTVSKSVD